MVGEQDGCMARHSSECASATLNGSDSVCLQLKSASQMSPAAAPASEAINTSSAYRHSSAEAVNALLATAAPLTSFDPTEVAAAADKDEPAAGGEDDVGASLAAAPVPAASGASAGEDDPPSKKVTGNARNLCISICPDLHGGL